MIKFSLLNLLPPYVKNGARFPCIDGKNTLFGDSAVNDRANDEKTPPQKNNANNFSENAFQPKSSDNSLEAINAFYIRHEKAKNRSKKTPPHK